jgi:hypothetical protein
MAEIAEKEMKMIRKRVEAEFPNDPALQQVHIARKIIAREAELEGFSFIEYVKLLCKRVGNAHQSHRV